MTVPRSLFSAVTALLLICAFGCVSERPADLRLSELEAKMQAATDPDGLGEKATSFYERQSLCIPGIFSDTVFSVEVRYKRPGRMKIVTKENNKEITEIIFNGGAAWIADYRNRKVRVLHGEAFDRVKAFNHLSTPGMTFRKVFDRVELTLDELDGQECYKLSCHSKLAQTEPLYVYVDKKSFLIKAIRARFLFDDKMTECDSRIVEYSFRNGVRIPLRVDGVQDGLITRTTVAEYQLNVDFDDDEFLPPLFSPVRGI